LVFVTKDESSAVAPSLYVNDALYERLIALDRLWKQPGDPPARELVEICERLIKREARLLDDGEFERWIELFSRECIYWIPLGRANDPRREVTVEFHDRRRLADRVARLRTGSAYSQIPPTRTCHLLSNLEIFSGGAGELPGRCPSRAGRMVRIPFCVRGRGLEDRAETNQPDRRRRRAGEQLFFPVTFGVSRGPRARCADISSTAGVTIGCIG
jgi:hypothetical protein